VHSYWAGATRQTDQDESVKAWLSYMLHYAVIEQ